MQTLICLMRPANTTGGSLETLLERSGLTVWRSESAADYLGDPRAKTTLCVIADMPGQSGLTELVELRLRGGNTPAILLTTPGAHYPQAGIAQARILEALSRVGSERPLLAWIQCICAAHLVMDRRLALQRARLDQAA